MLLGMDKYLSKYRQCEESLIVNIASVAGLQGFPFMPLYCATKHAILGMVKSWGHLGFYNDSKVKVIGICPGPTNTPLNNNIYTNNLGGNYEKLAREILPCMKLQE